MKKHGGQGFTIVEILIVVVIVGILAAIVIVGYIGITQRAYYNRTTTELHSIAEAINAFEVMNGRWPNDVSRGLPPEIAEYLTGSSDRWPDAPWPNSVYDYDYFIGSDGKDVSQITIRFCPAGGPLSACTFPNEPWAAGFGVNSGAYWCVTGKCKSHPSELDTYPGYCVNCNQP